MMQAWGLNPHTEASAGVLGLASCSCGNYPSQGVPALSEGMTVLPGSLEKVSLGPWGTTRHGLWAALGGISGPWLAPGSCCFRLAEEDLVPAMQSAWSS